MISNNREVYKGTGELCLFADDKLYLTFQKDGKKIKKY